MYFAGNAVISSIVGAVSGSLIYEYIKNIFITKDFKFTIASSSEEAFRNLFGKLDPNYVVSDADLATVFNFGNLIVPFFVATFCILGVFAAFLMPRDYSAILIAKEMKKQDPSLDISEIEAEAEAVEKKEIIFVQIGLWVLSGSLFGFIWSAFLVKSTKAFKGFINVLVYAACAIVPFAQIPFILIMRKKLLNTAKKLGVDLKIAIAPLIVLSVFFPILPINLITLAILQHKANKLVKD
jgi:hypothetical protein